LPRAKAIYCGTQFSGITSEPVRQIQRFSHSAFAIDWHNPRPPQYQPSCSEGQRITSRYLSLTVKKTADDGCGQVRFLVIATFQEYKGRRNREHGDFTEREKVE